MVNKNSKHYKLFVIICFCFLLILELFYVSFLGVIWILFQFVFSPRFYPNAPCSASTAAPLF